MDELIKIINYIISETIKEINDTRLPALEIAWGRAFPDEFSHEDQLTVEIAKNYVRIVNNCFFRNINKHLPEFKEHTTNGSDYIFGDIPIEDKNSFSPSNNWVGNGFKKTGWHLLKKFKCNTEGKITHAFVALVNLDDCVSCWSDKVINTNRSAIDFKIYDKDVLHIIFGDIKLNKKKIKPILKEIIYE
jgi:hypothetical protein